MCSLGLYSKVEQLFHNDLLKAIVGATPDTVNNGSSFDVGSKLISAVKRVMRIVITLYTSCVLLMPTELHTTELL